MSTNGWITAIISGGIAIALALGTTAYTRAMGTEHRLTVVETGVDHHTVQLNHVENQLDHVTESLGRIEGTLGTKPGP